MLGGVRVRRRAWPRRATATPTSIAHAVADALLGAAGLGDIGQHFPDTDPQWAGADSIALLAEVAAHGAGRGLDAGQRRLHRRLRGAEAGAAAEPRWRHGSRPPPARR